MGMPCSHMIYSVDGRATALQKTDFHPRHWTEPNILPRTVRDAYYGIFPTSPPSPATDVPLLSVDDIIPSLKALPTVQQH